MTRLRHTLCLLLLLTGGALLPALAQAGPVRWQRPADSLAREAAPAPLAADTADPVRLSLLDVLGKVSIAVLLIYALAFAAARFRGLASLPSLRPRFPHRPEFAAASLRLRESCPLPRHEGTLYLVECEGKTLLLGASAQQLEVLWSPAPPDNTSSFAPVPAVLEAPATPPGARYTALDEALPPRPPVRPAKPESEWARERSRLISALMQGE